MTWCFLQQMNKYIFNKRHYIYKQKHQKFINYQQVSVTTSNIIPCKVWYIERISMEEQMGKKGPLHPR